MFPKTFNIQPRLAVIAVLTTLNGLSFAPLVQAQETEIPFKESLQSQTTFIAQECSVLLSDPEEEIAMACDRLSVTEGDGTINFHYDDGEKIGFSFVLTYNDEPVLVNEKISVNEYDVIGTFVWTSDSGIVEETLTEATGKCKVDEDKVLCQATIDTKMTVNASVKF